MSYSCHIYSCSEKANSNIGKKAESLQLNKIEASTLNEFQQRLKKYQYKLQRINGDSQHYEKEIASSVIEVIVTPNCISFSVAYNNPDLIFKLLQDATELSDSEELALYNPQTGEWID